MIFIKVPADQVDSSIYDCSCHEYHVRPRATLHGFYALPLDILEMECMPEIQKNLIQSFETMELGYFDFQEKIVHITEDK